jgi:hypothetical protein
VLGIDRVVLNGRIEPEAVTLVAVVEGALEVPGAATTAATTATPASAASAPTAPALGLVR